MSDRPEPSPGGYRELIALSAPLVLSSSFVTVQIFIDRVFVSRVGTEAAAAAMPAVAYFWTPFALLYFTVMYATVFVAQYVGAGRPRRVGPVVWQAGYFSVAAGLLFPLLGPVVDRLVIAQTNHPPAVKAMESAYFGTLVWAALPTLLVATVSGFFAGRGKSWTVLLINVVGSSANVGFAYLFIARQSHDPLAAMTGAGYALTCGTWVAAVFGLALLAGRQYRDEFATLSGWRFDRELFVRFLWFGLPNGLQWLIEGLAFTAFILIVGNMGAEVAAATTLTFSLNMLTFLPVMGLGQGVEVLVGRRQGEKRPELSARTTWTGVKLALGWMGFVAVLYCGFPGWLAAPFAAEMKPDEWARVGPLIPVLLRYVAAYSLCDGVNIILAYALRGAGDTRFVVLVSVALSWPLMVIPTWLVWKYGYGVEPAWGAATVYLAVTAGLYVVRFLGGKWRTMTVIEPHVAEPDAPERAEPAGVVMPKLPV